MRRPLLVLIAAASVVAAPVVVIAATTSAKYKPPCATSSNACQDKRIAALESKVFATVQTTVPTTTRSTSVPTATVPPTTTARPTTAPTTTTPPTTKPTTIAPTTTKPTTSPTSTTPPGNVPYVLPGTQGYKGAASDLTVYSAANGKVPTTGCHWDTTYLYLDCTAGSVTLDHAYVQGGIYFEGCGSLKITNSIVDYQPSKTWMLIYAACEKPLAGSTITVQHSTLESGPGVPTYTGGSDIGGIMDNAVFPMMVSNTLIQGFPQGLDPSTNSVIQNNEIYLKDAQCPGEICHGDGLFSQYGDNLTYQGNYIVATQNNSTAAIFYQSTPQSHGNKVIGNYLQGGAFTLYNETSLGLVVLNNTFGGYVYGDVDFESTASWSQWSGNVHKNGSAVPAP